MDCLRSPTGSGSNSPHGGSQPNLSELQANDLSQITICSKRKLPDDNKAIRNELSELRKQMSDMMAILKSSKNDQRDNIKKLCQDVADIKNEDGNISNTIENIILENKYLKTEISTLKTMTETTEVKLKTLESDVNELKRKPATSDQTQACQEEIIKEIQERKVRAKNIVVIGIPECKSNLIHERQEYEKKEVMKIINLIHKDCPQPDKIFRLGKYKPKTTRSIKICFSSEETVKTILRNENSFDRTSNFIPYQSLSKEILTRPERKFTEAIS